MSGDNTDHFCWQHQKSVAGKPASPLGNVAPSVSLESSGDLFDEEHEPISLYDYQEQAVSSVLNELDRDLKANERPSWNKSQEKVDRCQARAMCGMGKTVMAQEIVRQSFDKLPNEEKKNAVYVFVTSGVDLTDQSRADFEQDGILNADFASVHHKTRDFGLGATAEERDAGLEKFMQKESNKPKVVFVTYRSLEKVAEAQHKSGKKVKMTLFDESHNIAGERAVEDTAKLHGKGDDDSDGPSLSTIKSLYDQEGDKESLHSDKRVFLTATPNLTKQSERTSRLQSNPTNIKSFTDSVGKRLKSGKSVRGKENQSLSLRHDDRNIFGNTVVNYGLKDAREFGVMTELRANVSSVGIDGAPRLREGKRGRFLNRVSVDGSVQDTNADQEDLNYYSYSAASSTIDFLGTGEGNNALAFLDRVDDTKAMERNFQQIAFSRSASLNGGRLMESDEAREVVESDPSGQSPRVRAARTRLIGDHAKCRSANSEMSLSERREVVQMFPEKSDQKDCECGQPGRWCACARVVPNVNLFGEGISVKSIDTCVIASRSKSGDRQLTQAVGRAMRTWSGSDKSAGYVVTPDMRDSETGAPIDPEITNSTVSGVSRLVRDVQGVQIDGRSKPKGRDESPLPVRSTDGRQLTENDIRSELLVNYREAKAVKEVANSAHEVSRKLLGQMKDSGSKAVAARASSFGQIKYVSDQLRGDGDLSDEFRANMASMMRDKKIKPDGLASLDLFTKENLQESDVRRANATLSDLHRAIDENDPSWINREDGSSVVAAQKTSTAGSNGPTKMSISDHLTFLRKQMQEKNAQALA